MDEKENQKAPGDINSILKAITDNPDMLSQAFSLAAKLKESGIAGNIGAQAAKGSDKPLETERAQEKIDEEGGAVPALTYKKSSDADNRRQLLFALRPYLSSSRREKLDSLLRLSTLLDTASNLGITKPTITSRN